MNVSEIPLISASCLKQSINYFHPFVYVPFFLPFLFKKRKNERKKSPILHNKYCFIHLSRFFPILFFMNDIQILGDAVISLTHC